MQTEPALALPCAPESEQCVLGSVLLAPNLMHSLRGTLTVDEFSTEAHRQIWGAYCVVYDSGAEVDATHVFYALERLQQHSQWLSYAADLITGVVPEAIEPHVARVKERAELRQVMRIAHNAMIQAGTGTATAHEILASLQSAEIRNTTATVESSREIVDRLGIDSLLNPQKNGKGVRLPWARLQDSLDGFRAGQMIVCAAYTSRGKTSLACQIAVHATRQSVGAVYWTMEMPAEAVLRRMIFQMGGNVDAHAYVHKDSVAWLYDHPIHFDQRSQSVPSFVASVRTAAQKRDIGIAIVDHLQLVRWCGRTDSRAREVGENSRALKLAAMDLGIPILVLSQVRRPSEKDTRLGIHMLKESGDVENDADVVLLMNSGVPNGYDPVPVSINIAKQREGPAGFDVPLVFQPRSQSFEGQEA